VAACTHCGAALPEGASFCPACAAPVELEQDRAERKLATVLFGDLVGSTELAGGQDPERTRARLERFYDAMAAEIETAGGTVEKFAGDAVMAAFGAPEALEDHAERALHTALSMQRRLASLFDGKLALRIGVNTGEVVVGRAREGSSFVSGDAVNVAARLEQAAEPGEILAGERTVAAVRGAFEFAEPATVAAKGKPDGVACRRVVRALSLMRPRGVGGLARAFVGRDEELERVRVAYRRCVEGSHPVLVTIVGDAGVGKTRLVRELWEQLADEDPEPLRRTGRCVAYGQGITYWPLGEVLKEHLGVLENDRPEEVRRRLAGREILGLTLGLDLAGDLHPLAARDRLHEGWIDFVSELAADRPVVLLVEDVHWAEEPLLDLLERLARDARGPLLLLLTARPDFAQPGAWGARMDAETIWLEPLPAQMAASLVSALVAAELPRRVRELVVERAEGNPFFVEEVLGSLIDTGVLERANGGWIAHELPPGFEIPDSVQAVLAARIDLLGEAEKAALQAAAVIGRTFWTSPVYELVEGLEPDLRLLETRDFVRRRAGSSLEGEVEYAFKHALTREVAYGSLTRRERAHLHADLASWLERRGRDEDSPLLARHYAEAVRPEDVDLVWSDEPERHAELRASAVKWLRRAADLAAGRNEIEDALALLGRALVLEPEAQSKIEILRQTGQFHTLRFDPQGFRAAMEEALAQNPARAVEADIYADLAYYSLGRPYMWKEPPPRALGEQWLAKALELSAPESSARAWALLAQALSDPSMRAEAAKEADRLGEALGEARIVIFASEAQSLRATEAGLFQEACDWADRAIAAAPKLANPNYEGHLHWNAGFVYARAGRFGQARSFAESHDRIASSLTAHEEVHAVGLHAAIESALGEWQVLAELTGRAEAASAANEDFPCQFNWRNLLVCALGLARVGEERQARRLEEIGRASAVVGGPPEVEPALLRLSLLRGDEEQARRILEASPTMLGPWGIDVAAARLDAWLALGETKRIEEEGAPFLEEESYTQAFALRALGVSRSDSSLVQQAALRFEAMGLGWRAEETRSLAGTAL
jgi:class 3 adenylate cyclase/tetratricopeptide (TPR) repeat protein